MKGSSEVGTFDVKPPYLTGKGTTTDFIGAKVHI
jgi:hypothetical protein